MLMKRIAIVCNGALDHSEKMKERIQAFPKLVAVDGGAQHCWKLGLRPDYILGDFDSCPEDTLEQIAQVPRKKFPKLKDRTDLELALDAFLDAHTQEITLFAASGERLDHTLNNILILSRYKGRLFIETSSERLFVIDREVTLSCAIGQTLSLLPINGAVTDIDTDGLQWNLAKATLDKHFTGISNSAIQSRVSIRVGNGDLLCCLLF
jgi:thiamine pyrophosphokinase